VDLGVAAGGVELGFGYGGFVDAEDDVGADGAVEEGGFLRDQGDLGAVVREVER
jgi:hypothetical protein